MFLVLAESNERLGSVTLVGDDMEAVTEGMHVLAIIKYQCPTYVPDIGPIERNVEPAEPTCPLLWMQFTAGTSYAL